MTVRWFLLKNSWYLLEVKNYLGPRSLIEILVPLGVLFKMFDEHPVIFIELLFCSLSLLFGDVLVAVAVVVCLSSLLTEMIRAKIPQHSA